MPTKPTKKRRAGSARGGNPKRGKTVDQLTKEAKAKDALGPQIATGAGAFARRVSRDRAIVAARRAGRSTREIAGEFKLSQRAVQVVLARRVPSPLDAVPMELVEEALSDFVSQMETWAALLAGAAEAGNYNAAVAAARGYADARKEWFEKLSEMGKLPENLELFKVEAELTQLGKVVLDALKAVKKGEMTAEEAHARVRELVITRELPVVTSTATDL